MRTSHTVDLHEYDIVILKKKLLTWSQNFDEVIWLDSNDYPLKESEYDAILAVDAHSTLRVDDTNGFQKLKVYQKQVNDWIFGFLGYDLKNDSGEFRSENVDNLHFPQLYFFQPRRLFLFKEKKVRILYLSSPDTIEKDWQEILGMPISSEAFPKSLHIKARTAKENYVEKVNEILHRISRGDLMEMNLCQEFYAEDSYIDPLHSFFGLNEISRPPFSAFLKLDELYALSASPERYIKRKGNRIITQPIKGTAKRSPMTEEDEKWADRLKNDPKEIAENQMITELVQEDLKSFAVTGSVKVEEFCGLYSFKQVHQLISTISCEVAPQTESVDIIRQTFPMGSMIGTPKNTAIEVIEEMEDAKRGLYSGAIGYFQPNGNFDFNVVIRSILYNSERKYVSFSVGSAITAQSTPEREYDECLVKAKAMRTILENQGVTAH